jgi:hypothetical protein
MWSKTEYLGKLGLSFDHEMLDNVARAEEVFSRFAGEPLDVMFIGTRLDEDGVPRYGSLWYFSDSHVYYSPNFRSEEEVNYCINLRGTIKDCDIEMEDCDLSALTGKSRMSVTWSTLTDQAFNMNAHGDNCQQLFEIVRRFLLP